MLEMATSDINLTRKVVYDLHQEYLSNGLNNNDNTLQIVKALGGIDLILSDYLSVPSMERRLDCTQLNQLEQIITTPKKYQQETKSKTSHPINQQIILETNSHFHHTFYQNDTFINSLIGEKRGKSLSRILNSVAFRIAYALSILGWLALLFVSVKSTDIGIMLIWRALILSLILIPHGIFGILSLNRKGFKLIIRTFEFWFKIGHVLAFSVLNPIYKVNYGLKIGRFFGPDYTKLIALTILNNMLLSIWFLSIVIVISSFDGFNVVKCWKIAMSAVITFVAVVTAVYSHWLGVNYPQYDVIILSFSMIAMMGNSMRNVALFFFKQCFFSCINKRRAAIIRYSPVIIWDNSGQNKQRQFDNSDGHLHIETLRNQQDDGEPNDDIPSIENKIKVLVTNKDESRSYELSENDINSESDDNNTGMEQIHTETTNIVIQNSVTIDQITYE